MSFLDGSLWLQLNPINYFFNEGRIRQRRRDWFLIQCSNLSKTTSEVISTKVVQILLINLGFSSFNVNTQRKEKKHAQHG